MMEYMAQEFPGAFSGYKLEVRESHQRTKADTSGTAKAVINSFAKLGAPIKEVWHRLILLLHQLIRVDVRLDTLQ